MTSGLDEMVFDFPYLKGRDIDRVVRVTFRAMIETRMKLAELGMEIDVPKAIIVNGKRYTIDCVKEI